MEDQMDNDMLLSDRLAQGALPLSHVMQYAADLADALREIHDRGAVYGILEPVNIRVTDAGARIVYPDPGSAPRGDSEVTPYTAPEQLQGKTDSRSDVFAFGAVVYEMLAGRRAFEGGEAEALRSAILEREPSALTTVAGTSNGFAASLTPALNRLVMNCLAKEPQRRWQRMQKVQMELKLLSTQAKRWQAGAGRNRAEHTLRAEIAELEKRLLARLDTVDGRVGAVQQRSDEQEARLASAAQSVEGLQQAMQGQAGLSQSLQGAVAETATQIAALDGEISAQAGSLESLQSGVAQMASMTGKIEALENTVNGQVRSLESLQGEVAQLAPMAGKIEAVENTVKGQASSIESLQGQVAPMATMAGKVESLEGVVNGQARSIESLQAAIAQTDDLVERVVDTFETFQDSMLEQAEERNGAHGSAALSVVVG
jgi:archaellum component FlaC